MVIRVRSEESVFIKRAQGDIWGDGTALSSVVVATALICIHVTIHRTTCQDFLKSQVCCVVI